MLQPNVGATHFRFGTKAETLDSLAGRLKTSQLCPQYFFAVDDWESNRASILAKIADLFGDTRLAVRSSALDEDDDTTSMAGAYLSVMGVDSSNARDLAGAVERVIGSYSVGNGGNQVLVQPMVENVSLSGVAMSRHLDTGAPYFVINYDAFTGRTDTVTSGAESKTVLVLRSGTRAVHSQRIALVVATLAELEEITGCNLLDVEFCVTESNELFVLQVRRMAMDRHWTTVDQPSIDREISSIRARIADAMQPSHGIAGDRTIFGEMPDWNPVEMIGSTPKTLAYSLYARLITDRAWAIGRENLGYRPVGHRALMRSFSGRPYIDVRLSLNSLLPAELDQDVEARILEQQLSKLVNRRDLHDKIEFEIAHSCLDLDFGKRRGDLVEARLSSREIGDLRDRLLALTRTFLDGGVAALRNRLLINDQLEALCRKSADLPALARLEALITACEEKGTIPFSELARHAFVAVSFLRSMVSSGLIDQTEADTFYGSVRTVAAEIVSAMSNLGSGKIAREAFMAQYGHLRPGTYDITSRRYDEMPDDFLSVAAAKDRADGDFALDGRKHRAIDRRLEDEGFGIDADTLFAYMREAIRAREASKFQFTKAVSEILQGVLDWGRENGIGRDDLAHLHIDDVLGDAAPTSIRRSIMEAKKRFALTQAIRLPHLIFEPDDVEVIRIPLGKPTYITSRLVSAPCALVSAIEPDLDGYVVLIESADPGYDWIFSHKIVGLITKYGGANSHMTIRCAEFGIPAAIGCGARLFDEALKSRVVELNCASGSLRFIKRN